MKPQNKLLWRLWTLAGVVLIIVAIALGTANRQTFTTGNAGTYLVPTTGQTTAGTHLAHPKNLEIRGNTTVITNAFGHAQVNSRPKMDWLHRLWFHPNIK